MAYKIGQGSESLLDKLGNTLGPAALSTYLNVRDPVGALKRAGGHVKQGVRQSGETLNYMLRNPEVVAKQLGNLAAHAAGSEAVRGQPDPLVDMVKYATHSPANAMETAILAGATGGTLKGGLNTLKKIPGLDRAAYDMFKPKIDRKTLRKQMENVDRVEVDHVPGQSAAQMQRNASVRRLDGRPTDRVTGAEAVAGKGIQHTAEHNLIKKAIKPEKDWQIPMKRLLSGQGPRSAQHNASGWASPRGEVKGPPGHSWVRVPDGKGGFNITLDRPYVVSPRKPVSDKQVATSVKGRLPMYRTKHSGGGEGVTTATRKQARDTLRHELGHQLHAANTPAGYWWNASAGAPSRWKQNLRNEYSARAVEKKGPAKAAWDMAVDAGHSAYRPGLGPAHTLSKYTTRPLHRKILRPMGETAKKAAAAQAVDRVSRKGAAPAATAMPVQHALDKTHQENQAKAAARRKELESFFDER